MKLSNLKKRILTSFALLLIVALIFKSNLILAYSLIVIGVVSILEFTQILNRVFVNKFYNYVINLFFIFYIFYFCYFFFIFSDFINLKILLYILLFGCIGSDLGGFIVGKIFRGPKLTKISPKKTYSGFFGAIIFSVITVCILFSVFNNHFSYNVILLGIVVSLGCQFGDLLFSFLKRKAKQKDTGNILPGHGGVLDRIDGILLGVPVGYIFLLLIY